MSLPYEQVSPSDWAAKLDAVAWRATRGPKGQALAWEKVASCPRCFDVMNVSLGGRVGLLPMQGGPTTMAVCNCPVTHEGGELGAGCGAYGLIARPS